MIDPSEYTISIRKISIDGNDLFESSIREIPSVREYGSTYEEAYELALDSINTLAEMHEEEGRIFPVPAPKDDAYSGRITLRLAKSLHASCTNNADREGVSLNSWINTVLAEYVGRSIGYETARATYVETTSIRNKASSVHVVGNVIEIPAVANSGGWC